MDKKYLWIIAVIGLMIYFPIFFNGFVWDDLDFIINNPQVHQLNPVSLLGPNMFNGGPFYRPIPAVYFAIIYSLFGNQAFYYHALQLFLHLIGTCLVFVFFSRFFKKGISIFLALIFLVHPIQVESVAYIGSSQSELYFIPGIIALLLSQKQHLTHSRFLLIIGFLAISVFTKETGALFFLLIIASRLLYKLGKIKIFLLAGTLLMLFYFAVRLFIGGVRFEMSTDISIASISLLERLINIPAIFIYYLKTFILPISLIIWQQWFIKTINVENFVIPLLLSGLFILFLFRFAYVLYKKATQQAVIPLEKFKNKNELKTHNANLNNKWNNFLSFIFFMFWFLIGMSLILQVVPLDMTVAERWFYFPIIGLLGIIGVVSQVILASYKHNKKVIVITAIIILSLLSLRTFVRTFDYKNNLTLYSHDVKEKNANNYMLINSYAYQLYLTGNIDEAINYAKKADTIFPISINLNHLGLYYHVKKQHDKELLAYNRAIKLDNSVHFGN